jgi:hypothetical protein
VDDVVVGAVAGIVAQVRDAERQRATLRDTWSGAPMAGGTTTSR